MSESAGRLEACLPRSMSHFQAGHRRRCKRGVKSLGTTVDSAERANFMALLGPSIKRVQADVLKSDCEGLSRCSGSFQKSSTGGVSDQGMVQHTDQDGVTTPRRGSPGVARYNRLTGSIDLNKQVDFVLTHRR